MHVQRPGQNVTQDPLLIRCRRGLFRSDHVKLTQSYLWRIDYRRGGGRYGNGSWEDEQLTRAFVLLALWMTDIERWNVIFLYHQQCSPTRSCLGSCTFLRIALIYMDVGHLIQQQLIIMFSTSQSVGVYGKR